MSSIYILIFIYTATRYLITIPISSRTQVPNLIAKTIHHIHNHFSRHPLRFHSDNAREYTSRPVTVLMHTYVINQTSTEMHHPEINCIAELLNRNILNVTRCALSHSRLPPNLWKFSNRDETYKYNRIPHSAGYSTPSELCNHSTQPPATCSNS